MVTESKMNGEIMIAGELIQYNDIISAVYLDKPLRDRALLATLYLSNSRVNEICKRLRVDQVKRVNIAGDDCLLFEYLYTEKNPRHPLRNVPVRIEDEEILCNLILQYRDTFNSDAIMFPFTRQRASQIMKHSFGFKCHDMRHTRLTHLATKYNFSDQGLKKLAGWASNYASTYVHLNTDDIVKQMKK